MSKQNTSLSTKKVHVYNQSSNASPNDIKSILSGTATQYLIARYESCRGLSIVGGIPDDWDARAFVLENSKCPEGTHGPKDIEEFYHCTTKDDASTRTYYLINKGLYHEERPIVEVGVSTCTYEEDLIQL
ncbi:uncharacterized protein L199_006630 [Kwoniella botswanensis]|uniref:uncharacterized protein n=1 Tax=Kwoniella botswanensis TaxID=1268659 RepID=UPI00315D677E